MLQIHLFSTIMKTSETLPLGSAEVDVTFTTRTAENGVKNCKSIVRIFSVWFFASQAVRTILTKKVVAFLKKT